jgi:hypothetical protein
VLKDISRAKAEAMMPRTYRVLCVCVALIALVDVSAHAQAPIADDAYVSSASPSTVNGTNPSLVVQAPSGWTLIKFDLSRLPAVTTSSQVSKATVKLYTSAVAGQGAFDLYRIDGAWKESTITYSSSTLPFQSALTLPMSLVNAGTACPSTNQCVTTASKYVIVDVTSIVKDWLDSRNGIPGAHPNNGIAFKPSSGSSISVTFESKESTTTSHDPELNIVLMPASFVSTLTTTAPIGNTGSASSPNIAITGLIPSGNLSGTYDISITGSAATATSALSAIAANSATTAATATNSSQLGGVSAANFARVDQANTFTGLNILGNSSAAAGGLVIPPSGTGANKNSFLFNLQSAGASATNTFALQVSTTPSLNFMFCNSSPSCIPAITGLSVANNGIINFAAGQTFPGTGTGTVTNFSSSNMLPLFTTTVVNSASTPALSFSLNTQAAHTMFAGPVSGTGTPTFRGLMAADIPNIAESQVANLTSDLASKATAAVIAGSTNTKITYNNQGIVTGGVQAQFSDLAGTVTPAQVASGTYSISINGNAASATNAANANFATTAGSASTANTANTASSAIDATNLAGVAAANYARRDQANSFIGGKQTMPASATSYASLNVPNSSTVPSTPAVGDVWLSNADGHLQFQDASNATQSLAFASDVSAANNAASTSLNNEISRATAAENTIGSNLSNEITRAQNAETAETSRATSAETGLSGAISVEASRATAAESVITGNVNAETTRATAAEASKANLAGGNTFTGGAQVLAPSAAGYASLNVPNSSTAPSTPAVGDVWLTTADTHLQFQDKNNVAHSLMFSDDPIQNNQLQNNSITVTSGIGIGVSGSPVVLGGTVTLSNTGVLSFNGRNGSVSPASGDYSFGEISGTIIPSQVSAGTYGIDISGNAGTANTAASATNAANASLLSGEAAATSSAANTIAARDTSGDLFANIFHGSGASLTNLPATALPNTIVYNSQANTYDAGSKQTFVASAIFAGLNVAGTASDPSGPLAAGDAWYNSTGNRLKFFNGTATKSFAFTDDNITGNAANVTGTVGVANGGSGATTASGARSNFGAASSGANSDVTSMTALTSITSAVTMGNASNLFSGNGAGLTALNASNLSTGTVAAARLPLATSATAGATSAPTCTAGQHYSSVNSSGVLICSADSVITSLAFNNIAAGSNTAALTVGDGGSLAATGTGTITATSLAGPFGIPVPATQANSGTLNTTGYTPTLGGTPGTNPSVNVTVGASGTVMVIITSAIQTASTNPAGAGPGGAVSFGISGNTTRAASDTTSLQISPTSGGGSPATFMQASATYMVTGLTEGSTTFTLNYRALTNGQTVTFSNRSIVVIPY